MCIHFFFLGSLNGHCTLSVRFGPCKVLKKLDRFGAKGLMLWTAPFNEETSCLHWQIVPGVNQSPEACLLQFPNNSQVCSPRIFLKCLKVKCRPSQFLNQLCVLYSRVSNKSTGTLNKKIPQKSMRYQIFLRYY